MRWLVNYCRIKYLILIVLFSFFALTIHGCQKTQPQHFKQETIVVAIASSLKSVMTEVAGDFRKEYPTIDLAFNVAASGVLAEQIENNAPIDVFASANLAAIEELINQQKIKPQSEEIFAKNQLIIAAYKDADIQIQGLEDLSDSRIEKIALGNPKVVPAGQYAQTAMESFGDLYQTIAAEKKLVFGENVRQVAHYLETQAVDLGFIYKTDLMLSPNIKSLLSLPESQTGEINYAIAPISRSNHQWEVEKFIEFMLSEKGQEVIKKYGFLSIRD